MLYAVAQSYLLSGDRQALDRVMPQSMKALDWCLNEIRVNNGLVAGPLNDGTGEGVLAFNQAYLYAGLERFSTVLEKIGNPRATEAHDAPIGFAMRSPAFTTASARSTLVELRDHTWIPYVPGSSHLSPHSRPMVSGRRGYRGSASAAPPRHWHPMETSVDSLLNDHEDNLFLKGWGVANEPVHNQQATAYLLRDDLKAVIRAFIATWPAPSATVSSNPWSIAGPGAIWPAQHGWCLGRALPEYAGARSRRPHFAVPGNPSKMARRQPGDRVRRLSYRLSQAAGFWQPLLTGKASSDLLVRLRRPEAGHS